MPVLDKHSYDTKTYGQGNANLYATDQTSGKKITPFKPDINITTTGGSASGVAGNSAPVNDGGATPSSKELYGGGGSEEIDPRTVYFDEIQKAASEKNYKTLLQSDIAAYNLKMGTQKHLDNYLAGQGLGTQGYGTTAHVGVENQAQNLYAQNLENYNEAEQTAFSEAQERQKSEATESDNQLVTFLQYSNGSDDSIAGYMDQYGYAQGKDGKWYRKDENGNPDQSQPASAYIQAAIQSAKENVTTTPSYGISQEKAQSNADAFLEAYKTDGQGYSIDDLKNLEVNANDNKETKTLSAVVGNEIEYLRKNAQYYQDGTLIKLERGSGAHEAYLVIYIGGKFYLVSSDDNEQDGGQVATRYNEYNGPKVEIKGK